MKNRVAVVRGTFLRPGVSKNKRLYTKDAIAGAVNRMKEQLNSPNGLPLTMATGHGAAYADDATSFVGRVTDVALNQDGSASFEADIANTTQGRDVATLISGDNPFLKTISIRGEWLGDVENVEYEGQKVTTSKDFRIYGIDFTSRPGVEGAQIEDVELLSESAIPTSQILESFEEFEVEDDAEFEIDEADGFSPPAGVRAEAKKALQWIKDGHAGSGFTDVGRKRASDLAAGRSVSLDTIKRMNSFLARHSVDKQGQGWSPGEKGFPSPGRVAYAAWGGKPAIGWVNKILRSQESKTNEAEDMADVRRHDQSHHAWHAMHGDPPCTSKEECDKMRAKYEAQAENAPNEAIDYSKIIPKKNGKPANQKLYNEVIAAAKKKFDVYPSAVANAWVSREYKSRGGRYVSEHEGINMEKISELLSEMLAEVEEADTTPYGEVRYADPGYQKDGVKRYPIDTKAHARAAWSYINQESSAHKYTAAQLARVKSRIKSAAKQFGINIISEQEMLASELQEVLEAYASIALVNDDDSISITGYATDPHQLKVVANRIAFGAIAAMHAIDPDDDGDIYLSKPDWSKVDATGDAGGMGPEDEDMMMSPDDNNMESTESSDIADVNRDRGVATDSQVNIGKEKMYCPSCNSSLPDAVTECSNCGESLGQCPNCECMQVAGASECAECGASMMNNESNNSIKTKEALVADTENVTEEVTESAPEAPARLLTDADLKALAVITAEAVSAVMNAKEVKEQADPEDVEEAPAADAEPKVAADENTPEGEMAESYSADDLKKAVAEALDSFKGEVAEAYRENGAPRKGIVANEISEEDIEEAFSTERLATLGTREFREAQYDAWSNVPFFKRMFDQADGFGRF
jgi:hypothetical protein